MRNILILIALFSVSGCKTTVQDGPHKVTYEDHHHDGGFCPPGQGKKGNC